MPSIILREPDFVRQTKMNSCWFACLQMLLKWHTGSGDIADPTVRGLASHFRPRSYDEIPQGFRNTHHLWVQTDSEFTSVDQIANTLRTFGPFMGGGTVGKFFIGKRRFGHAILIYGVTPSGHLLHHDPTLGPHCTIKGANYLRLQDGERVTYTRNPRVTIDAMGG